MMFCLENDCPLEMDKCSTPRQVVRTRNSCWKRASDTSYYAFSRRTLGLSIGVLMMHSDVAVGGT
ncbi:hypothetical protein OROGR_008009 [Orobanche gracilis]